MPKKPKRPQQSKRDRGRKKIGLEPKQNPARKGVDSKPR